MAVQRPSHPSALRLSLEVSLTAVKPRLRRGHSRPFGDAALNQRAQKPTFSGGEVTDPSVPVRVMVVRHMSMGMAHWLVPVQMTVPGRGYRVDVGVMRIVVRVRMLVFDCFVLVFMRVAFDQVQDDAGHHQRGPEQHPEAAAALAQNERHRCSDKRGERKDRPGSSRSKRALREEIEPKAEAIA